MLRSPEIHTQIGSAGWGTWWKIDSRVKEGEKSTEGRIRAAEERASKVAEELSGFKLRAAETYATKPGWKPRPRRSCVPLRASAVALTGCMTA